MRLISVLVVFLIGGAIYLLGRPDTNVSETGMIQSIVADEKPVNSTETSMPGQGPILGEVTKSPVSLSGNGNTRNPSSDPVDSSSAILDALVNAPFKSEDDSIDRFSQASQIYQTTRSEKSFLAMRNIAWTLIHQGGSEHNVRYLSDTLEAIEKERAQNDPPPVED